MTSSRPRSDDAGTSRLVEHRHVKVGGVGIFYREAGPRHAPVVLLPHGYPCSSYQYRNLLPALGDRWRLIAPDFPGFGYSDTPDPSAFSYSFDGYAELLERFTAVVGVSRYALYLHDYGSQIGLRLAMRAPGRVAALIIQNGTSMRMRSGPSTPTSRNTLPSRLPRSVPRSKRRSANRAFATSS
jgi:pimeloyl-ACP methyl ester carboxylesterase